VRVCAHGFRVLVLLLLDPCVFLPYVFVSLTFWFSSLLFPPQPQLYKRVEPYKPAEKADKATTEEGGEKTGKIK